MRHVLTLLSLIVLTGPVLADIPLPTAPRNGRRQSPSRTRACAATQLATTTSSPTV